jgi:hypothetical protein
MQFDRGYLSPYFVNDVENMECEFEDATTPHNYREHFLERRLRFEQHHPHRKHCGKDHGDQLRSETVDVWSKTRDPRSE